MITMNISGVTQTAPILPPNQAMPQPPAVDQAQSQSPEAGADVINASMAASIQVMDMAQSAFEDSADALIQSMAVATGIGQNIDMSV